MKLTLKKFAFLLSLGLGMGFGSAAYAASAWECELWAAKCADGKEHACNLWIVNCQGTGGDLG